MSGPFPREPFRHEDAAERSAAADDRPQLPPVLVFVATLEPLQLERASIEQLQQAPVARSPSWRSCSHCGGWVSGASMQKHWVRLAPPRRRLRSPASQQRCPSRSVRTLSPLGWSAGPDGRHTPTPERAARSPFQLARLARGHVQSQRNDVSSENLGEAKTRPATALLRTVNRLRNLLSATVR